MSVAINSLNDQEKYFLLRLSYIDIPEDSFKQGMTLWDFLKQASMNTANSNQEDALKLLQAYKEFPKLQDIRFVDYDNHNPNQFNNQNSDETGFVGYALEDSQGNRGIMFRGTEPGNLINPGFAVDMGDNISSSLFSNSYQVKQAQAFYQENKNPDGTTFMYGHSKGGNLVSEVVVSNQYDDIQGYVVNGQPINNNLSDEQKKVLQDQVTFIIQDGDIVSHLGANDPYVDKYVKVDPEKGKEIWGPHALDAAQFDENGNLIIEEHPYRHYPVRHFLAELAEAHLELICGIEKLIWKTGEFIGYVVTVTLQFIKILVNYGIELANKFKEAFIAAVLQVFGVAEGLIKAVKKWFSDVQAVVMERLNYVKEWFKKAHQQIMEPYISVDIAKLHYYAQRVAEIRGKVQNINARLDRLYYKVGLFDLDNIFKADLLTEYSFKLNRCISYFNNTAELLDNTEYQLVKRANSI